MILETYTVPAEHASGQRAARMMNDADGGQVGELVKTAKAFASPETKLPELYGSFWIDGTEYALPVDVIQEVVNEPTDFTPVPLSPDFLVGLFHLRGNIVSVIDLRVLLEIPAPDADMNRKVAIIQNGDYWLGLLFDDTGGVINADGVARVNFEPNSEGIKDVVVEGMLKLDDGARLVQILDPYELLSIDRLPRVATGQEEDNQRRQLGKRSNCISFQLGHTTCAIDLRYVQEITEIPELQNSILSDGHLLGNIDLRGQTVPVVDFRGMIGKEAPFRPKPEALRSRKLVIMELETGMIGLMVYSIDSILSFFESEILQFAKFAIPRQDLVQGCLINDSKDIVILLDHDRLMQDAFLLSAAQSCQEIYPSEHEEQRAEKAVGATGKKTFILFSVGKPFALDISHVSEIINRPDDLLTPPYSMEFIDGILNLRGELITLISLRRLYGLKTASTGPEKVLIVRQDGQKYGIVVSSVDEIFNAAPGDVHDVPTFSTEDRTREIADDFSGCLMASGYTTNPSMILRVNKLIARCMQLNPDDNDGPSPAEIAAQQAQTEANVLASLLQASAENPPN